MSNQINESAARYKLNNDGTNPPVPSAAQAPAAGKEQRNPQKLVTDHLDLWTSTVTPKSTSGRGRGSGKSSKLELTGINKLRELILELAVRGKLVPQNPADEPASELLKRIEVEKAQLVKDGKLKKQKPLPPVTDEEQPFELPDEWEWVRLGEVFNIVYGKGLATAELTDEGYDVFGANGLIGKYHSYTYEQPQLLISCRGAYSGKANLSPEYCLVTSNSLVLENTWKLLSLRFFYYQLSVGDKSAIVTGSAQPQVTTANLSPYAVGLPPLAEQHRIVAKVDELMALCDQLEQQSEHQLGAHQQLTETLLATLTDSADAQELNDNWQCLAQHFDLLFSGPMGAWAIDRLKDTILQLAVMGKLVPQNPDDEPASALLKRIDAEKARLVKEGKIKKPKKLPPVSDEEKPFELPEGWRYERLANLADIQSGIAKGKKFDRQDTVTFPYLRVANVQRGFLILDEMKEIEILKSDVEKYAVIERDLLITEGGDWDKVGRTAIWPRYDGIMLHQNHVFKARLILADQSEIWMERYLNSSFARKYFAGSSKQTTNLASINKTQLSNTVVPIPPLAEQHRIVAKVDELFALCDQLKERLQQASETELNLTEAIVEQALA